MSEGAVSEGVRKGGREGGRKGGGREIGREGITVVAISIVG